ncbi:MAG TPA: MgtC/SapB family protein [Rhodanobacteraceae bacterium]|jgi:putative Mg2+ transporter-C (MgtC) family protein|nr:MgtC/SapB family protein [Rhodanobacteraceae bacterium]
MLSTPEIAIRLLLAAVLGGVIGFDRERHTWAAGLRTHMLVCLGAALAMIVSAFAFSDVLKQWPHVVLDPSRIAAQVISGIGFLGAGTIMFLHRENVIRGLTTAAGLWTVAAIGLAVGGGMYLAAVIATAVAWVILAALKPLERRFALRKTQPQVRIGFSGRASLAAIEQVLTQRKLPASTIVTRHIPDDGDAVSITFDKAGERGNLGDLADALRALPGVASVTLEVTPPGG